MYIIIILFRYLLYIKTYLKLIESIKFILNTDLNRYGTQKTKNGDILWDFLICNKKWFRRDSNQILNDL